MSPAAGPVTVRGASGHLVAGTLLAPSPLTRLRARLASAPGRR